MSKELVISADRHETKVAILEDDQLVEVFFQRDDVRTFGHGAGRTKRRAQAVGDASFQSGSTQ